MENEHPIFKKVRTLESPLREMFPGTRAEIETWKPTRRHRALARCVLAAAQTRIEFAWGAYIDAVPGISHRDEFEEVLRHRDKLPEAVARILFPQFRDVPYAH